MPKWDRRALGKAVAGARREADLTLAELAGRSQVSRRLVVDIEGGRANPGIDKLHSLAHVLGVPLAELLASVCDGHCESED